MLATSPALFDAGGDRFLGYGVAQAGRVTPGDHLQTIYDLWLPGHQLARGSEPWLDPYSFQPELPERVNPAGWPFAIVFGPLEAVFGAVAGWNLFVLLTYVGAGGLAALWLRALGLPLGAALAGGLVFSLAPYRVAQSTGHLLGPISMLLPLALYGVERRRGLLTVAALASIPLSGQVHLALGAIPFVLAYAWARGRWKMGVVASAAGVAAGVAVWALTLDDTRRASVLGGRALFGLARRLRRARSRRLRALRLPRLADADRRGRRPRARPSASEARRGARSRRARPVPARARLEPARLPDALDTLAPSLDARPGASAPDRVPLPRRARGVRARET